MNVRAVNLKGERGGIFINDTAAHVGSFDAILAHEASVAALVSINIEGDLSAVDLPAGIVMYGKFTSVTLASGSVTAYKMETYA